MKILHYALGFPPYRSGGLTKFCMDLALQQKAEGFDVSLLWPGKMELSAAKTKIRKRPDEQGIHSFELINPTPVSYDEGIGETEAFCAEGDPEAYKGFLKVLAPDVIHIHTFMGLHKRFLEEAKGLGIQICFTAHDFFPICPKITLFRERKVCSEAEGCTSCPECNGTALSLSKIRILQSPLYRKMKDTPLVKKLRKGHRDEYLSDEEKTEVSPAPRKSGDYLALRQHFESMLSLVDVIHFNSQLTKSVYERFFTIKNCEVIPISHSGIENHSIRKEFGEKLRLSFLSPQSALKGYYVLRQALDELWKERQDFSLYLPFYPQDPAEYELPHGRYSYQDLEGILKETDVVIVPSIGYETFGYTLLEAMSFSVPVIASDFVGAKDVIPQGGGLVVPNNDPKALKDAIRALTPEKLRGMNDVLQKTEFLTLKEMSRKISEVCYQKA